MVLEESSWGIKSDKFYPKLEKDIKADVVIIGAGITGIFNAYILSKAGLSVLVLEREKKILQNATFYTTAFITKIVDTYFYELVSLFGKDKAKSVWQSGQDAISLIADIVKKENIECEFKFVSAYIYSKSEKQFEKLTDEYSAIKKSGIETNIQKNGKKLNFKNCGFLEIPDQAKFHPIKFCQALAKLAEDAGAKIFVDSEVISIDGLTVKTKTNQAKAKNIIIATYNPYTNEGTSFKKAMYVSYVYELEISKNLIPEGMYLDMDNPYHYFRIDSYENFDRMIVGGEDHRKDIKINPQKNFNALEKYVKNVLGENKYKITRKWDGSILESVDGLPFIGEIKPHTFVLTAFSGSGMTYAPISSLIMRDLISANYNPYAELYSPKRAYTFKQLIVKGGSYVQEFFGGALKNFFLSKDKI